MDGILLINKPAQMTSRDLVNITIKKFHFKKIGHTGTLDPFATGLMILTLGKGTKAGPFLENLDKTYIATLKLGIKTETLDKDGVVLETRVVPSLSKEQVTKVLKSMVGELVQIPPMYSAIKMDGTPLYELARKGIEVERKERNVIIHAISLIEMSIDEIKFEVRCSKGTYIRTLGEQIAEKLGTIGHLIELERTSVGSFSLSEANNIEAITEQNLISVSDAIKNIKKVIIKNKVIDDAKNGKRLKFIDEDDCLLLIDTENNAIAIYKKLEDGYYKSVRGLF